VNFLLEDAVLLATGPQREWPKSKFCPLLCFTALSYRKHAIWYSNHTGHNMRLVLCLPRHDAISSANGGGSKKHSNSRSAEVGPQQEHRGHGG